MRLHRFYSSEAIGNRKEVTLTHAELVHQLRHVFRLRVGDSIVVFDGSGSEYVCAIARFDGDKCVVLDVRESARARYTPSREGRKVWLFAAVVKKDNFEFIAEKATELGVTDIVPVIAARTEKKSLNDTRLARIVTEASEQSGRGDLPTVHGIMSVSEAVAAAQSMKAIAFHTEGASLQYEDAECDTGSDADSSSHELACFVGPEGGWTAEELALFHTNKIAVRCLGPQVLRAETAVIAALSQVVFRV